MTFNFKKYCHKPPAHCCLVLFFHYVRCLTGYSSRQSPNTTPKSLTISFGLSILIFICSSLITGCHIPPTSEAQAETQPIISGVQFTHATPPGIGYNTLEVYITNPGQKAATFTSGSINGQPLPSLNSGSLALLARQFKFSMSGLTTSKPLPTFNNRHITWWQIQPSPTLNPGTTAICQINFLTNCVVPGTLELTTDTGVILTNFFPRFSQPVERITALTWDTIGKKMFLQYMTKGAELSAIRINHNPVKPDTNLISTHTGFSSIAVLSAPHSITFQQQTPLFIELDFSNGSHRYALVRPLTSIMLDAPQGWERDKTLPIATRKTYSFDNEPAIAYLPIDVMCGDTRAKINGAGAPSVTAARQQAWSRQPNRLYGVEFCTARYKSAWNIYTPIADAIFIKPYQLHWGPDPARFIENEASLINTAISAAAPRPAVWVPERFKLHRHVEGSEHNLLAWIALTSGIKGIRYHHWMNDLRNPFRNCPDLDAAIQAVNAEIKQLNTILTPLIPISTHTDRTQNIITHESWAGDNGVFMLVRNMNYHTDGFANDSGKSPRHRITPTKNITINFNLPPWLTPAAPTNPLSGKIYCHTFKNNSLTINLPQLENFQLIWLQNHKALNVKSRKGGSA